MSLASYRCSTQRQIGLLFPGRDPKPVTWQVYRDALPLDGRPVAPGTVEARTEPGAYLAARERFPGRAVLVQRETRRVDGQTYHTERGG